MLEKVMDSYAVFYAVGMAVGVGIVCKMIVGMTLVKLVKASADMGKSTHRLMKLVRAKFEHACMLSDKVENIDAFVEKYIFEYKVFGIRLHTYRRIEKYMIWLSALIGGLGAAGYYEKGGVSEAVFQSAIFGVMGMLFLTLLYLSEEMSHALDMVKVYMIDYLENVYAPRYAKMNGKKRRRDDGPIEVTVRQAKEEEGKDPEEEAFLVEEDETEIQKIEEAGKKIAEETQEEVSQEVILREILEEFLA